jgi:predicted nuclease of predicted toxin-antitoxin system
VQPEPEPSVRLFIDRDLWSRHLDAALLAAGIPFERHRDHFDDDVEDPDWLRAVGARGWVVLTRDQNIRRRPNELTAVRLARMHVFALTSGNLSAAETSQLVIAARPRIRSAVHETAPPMLWSVTRGGVVRPLKR